ncbi:hypothetical protein DQ397_003229 [Pseudomonas sp. CK-NBRI-02]|uniref:hypothetical protein n=1 Tax=Pseudomonas sp. CK-NBRI-02 TaxID=2249759 RepID=UPI0005B926E9|nr:hypothetical protein [Pseudomonas sp. CK-NBRI-02]TYO74610.1 hypothetical protein DQ397_003229 [Pseudomonas sp. CK-NBRI-02]
MNNSTLNADNTKKEEVIPYHPLMDFGDIFVKEISISYAPNSDETHIAVTGKIIINLYFGGIGEYVNAVIDDCSLLLKIPKALVPAAFTAAQIYNGSGPVAPDETVYLKTKEGSPNRIAKHILIGPLPFPVPEMP